MILHPTTKHKHLTKTFKATPFFEWLELLAAPATDPSQHPEDVLI